MFSGLFNQQVTRAAPPASKNGAAQSKESKKKFKQQKADQPTQKNEQVATKSKKKKKKSAQDAKNSKAPAGGIPMTESEIEGFQKWLAAQKAGGAAETEKNGKASTKEQGIAANSESSKKVRKRSRKKKNRQNQEGDEGTENSATHPGSEPKKRKQSEDTKREDQPLSKKAKKRLRKQQLQQQNQSINKNTEDNAPLVSAAASLSLSKGGALSKAAARLQGSRFRWLNDTLYSISGEEALDLYKKDPSLATAYHEGFREQVRKWPRNPLDDVIQWLKNDVPRDKVVGDFGCGEARLALELKGRTVHSFDLIKINERVTPCNLAAVPLDSQTIDVAVFCLALMGTDWISFLKEAHRCLRQGGILQVMEVESRMSDINAMTRQVEALGFSKLFVKPGNFFIEMRFKKSGSGKEKPLKSNSKNNGSVLAGCTYRKR